MPCKLCEMSLDQQKFDRISCKHSPIFLNGSGPPVLHSAGIALQSNPFLPQIRDMMLAAYLLRAGYYQPAGPLITVPPPHSHGQPPPPPLPPLTKTVAPSEVSPTSSTTPSITSNEVPPPPPSSNGDSSDSEVIITSVTTAKENIPSQVHPATYRYPQYSGYPYPYTHPYPYPTGPPPPPSNPPYSHHDMCYSSNPFGHKWAYRRQYYPVPNPQELYPMPPAGPPQQSQQIVTAPPVSASGTYPPAPPGGPPPPPTLMETYAAPSATLVEAYQPPPHYYPSPAYGPPAPCYTHPPPRGIPYINTYQSSCPCPMQSCPKNVLTGPLTGDSKRPNISSISKDSMPLPPVALALPLEPVSATGPPSPARGSAGMPPPPSPAGATYQPPPMPTKQESHSPISEDDCKPEKKRKARIGKAMVRNNIAASMQQNTMLLMCNPSQNYVKREIESPKETEFEHKRDVSEEDIKPEELQSSDKQSEDLVKESQLPLPLELKEEKITPTTPYVEHAVPVQEEVEEILPPVTSTVAENVKVKNMKRKLSMTQEKIADPEISPCQRKKQKTGSYKYLIKRETSAIKINNGKRKLLGEIFPSSKTRKVKINLRPGTKKTLLNKEAVNRKKLSKPLNSLNCRTKEVKSSSETKEENPVGQRKVNSRVTKSAPAVLDKLFAKNNVERIIESVISDACLRTPKKPSAEKCAKRNKDSSVTTAASKVGASKKIRNETKKIGNCRRKSKCIDVAVPPIVKINKRSLQLPKWSNGWMWEGEPFEAKVFLNSDELTVIRRCYPAMRHDGGDKIVPRDCVLLKAGPRKNDLPFVAKIAALWENPDDGEMMMSLLWYYRPEHTEQGRLPIDQPDEVFASRHKDSNSVACIDDKCFVLTFNEYCRYRKTSKRIESGIEEALPCIPNPEPYPRSHRQPPMTFVSPEMIFFCRRVYDFRQKRIMKNPT